MPLFDFRNLYLGLAVVYFREVKTLQESLEAQVIIGRRTGSGKSQ